MIKKTPLRTLGFLGFAWVSYLVHRHILSSCFAGKASQLLLRDYSFITLSGLFVIALSTLTYHTQARYTGYTYLGASLLKMSAAMLFLFLSLRETPFTVSYFLNFTLAYFLLLAVELWVVLGLLKRRTSV